MQSWELIQFLQKNTQNYPQLSEEGYEKYTLLFLLKRKTLRKSEQITPNYKKILANYEDKISLPSYQPVLITINIFVYFLLRSFYVYICA